ncbi:MAG: prepilin-type N-terminal cleavage/methylation domain-containing protein [Candidatus Paceibacterota bacterium]
MKQGWRRNRKKDKKDEKGFTLIELMVIVAIIGLLSSVVLASLAEARQSAKNTEIVSNLKSVQNAIELYRSRNGDIPGSSTWNSGESSFTNALSPLVTDGFISEIPYPSDDIERLWYGRYPGNSYTCGGREINSYVLLIEQNPSTIGYLPNLYFNSNPLPNYKCIADN